MDNNIAEDAKQEKEKIKFAYKILSDPVIRKIYDEYSYGGLENGLKLSNNVQDFNKWRKLFFELNLFRNNKFFRTNLLCNIDVTSIVNNYYYRDIEIKSFRFFREFRVFFIFLIFFSIFLS